MTLSLASLKPVDVITVQIETTYGKVLKIPVGVLSFFEWQDCALKAPLPTAKQFKPKEAVRVLVDDKMTDTYPMDNDAYAQALRDYNNLVMMHRVAASLRKGGALPELDGLSDEETVGAIQSLDMAVIIGLSQAVTQLSEPKGAGDNAEPFRLLQNSVSVMQSNGQVSGVLVDEPTE